MLLSKLPRTLLLGTWVNRGLVCLLTLQGCIRTQPQREVLGLHGLPHHPYQFAIECLQVRLIAQLGGEHLKGLSRVVLPSVEAPVHERLDAAAQGVEQGGNQEGRCHDREGGPLACEDHEEPLQQNDAAEVDGNQSRRERAVDEGTVYEDVYLVEPIAKDRYAHRNGYTGEAQRHGVL